MYPVAGYTVHTRGTQKGKSKSYKSVYGYRYFCVPGPAGTRAGIGHFDIFFIGHLQTL